MAKEYQTHGRVNIVGWLSDNQALPNATGADSTNMVYIGGQTGSKLMISIFANTDIDVATAQAFNIELQGFTADTAASADTPGSKDNGAGNPPYSGTLMQEFHNYLVHKTSADGAIDWNAGDLIWEQALPDNMLRLVSYDWAQLVYLTDEDLSAMNIDAIIWAKP